MSTEITTTTPEAPAATPVAAAPIRAANPLDLAPAEFRQALARRSENRKALIEWIRGSLVDGVDFGSVPLRRGGFSKPSLRKPGAEKICGMLGVTATFPTLKSYETSALEGREVFQIILRCHLTTSDGQVVADGVGARLLEQDHGDMNKALKMAEKSAMIDATLRMAGLSEIFTQDLEDMPHGTIEGDTAAAAEPESRREEPRRPGQRGPKQSDDANGHTERLATDRQVKLIRVRLDQAGIPESELLEKFEIAELAALPFTQVNPALHWIAGASVAA
jgi:hypothetical protein